MLVVALIIGLVVLIAVFQLWWAAACWQAYRQVHAGVFLIQVAQGVVTALFFLALLGVFATGRTFNQVGVIVLLVCILSFTIAWRLMGGPATMATNYPRGLRDILAFRRPAVDLKRRVRGR